MRNLNIFANEKTVFIKNIVFITLFNSFTSKITNKRGALRTQVKKCLFSFFQ